MRGKRGNQSGIAPEVQQEGGVRVRSSTWLIDDVGDLHPRVGFAARVVRGDGAQGEVRLQLSGAQVRRERTSQHEDPRAGMRTHDGSADTGAGRTCARARQAETVAERLRREGARVHEDTQFEVGTGRPLADLRHVLVECTGLPDRSRRVEGLVVALDKVVDALPQRGDTARFHQLTCAARAALEASDTAVLTEAQWRHVDDVLAAFVPDFARTDSTPAERRALVKDVVSALQTVHGRAAGVVRDWQAAHRIELERRRDQEKYRGLLRTVVRAWREESDGRHARSLRVALPKGQLVAVGGDAGRLGAGDSLPTAHVPWRPPGLELRIAMRAGEDEKRDSLCAQRKEYERRGHGMDGAPAEGMSAVPAGSLARLLLTYARLVEGGRLQRRRQQSVRPARKEKGRLVPAGRPAEEAWKARVERVRQLELREGVTSPAMGGEAVGRTVRRRQRAVGLQGGWNADNTDACCSGRNSGGGGNDGAAGSGVGGGSDRNGVDGGGCDWGCEDCSGDCAGGDVCADVCGDGEGGGVEGGSGGEVGFGGEAERGSGKVMHGGEGGEGALRGTQRSGMYVRAFAGWDAGGRELPHRRLVSEEGLVRPRVRCGRCRWRRAPLLGVARTMGARVVVRKRSFLSRRPGRVGCGASSCRDCARRSEATVEKRVVIRPLAGWSAARGVELRGCGRGCAWCARRH